MQNITFSPPDITEEEITEVADALRSGWITTGPRTKHLEKEIAAYCKTEEAACLNSATAALELTLHVLGIGPGDEVITSAYTYTASASPIQHVGAKIVLVDTSPDSYEMDYKKVRAAITDKTKAVIPVDIAGIACDYDKLFAAVEAKRDIFQANNKIQKAIGRIAIVADAAHALGSQWHDKIVGEIADFTTFSFHAVKNFTTGEGGAVTWRTIPGIDNDELYKYFQLLSLHGQSKDALAKIQLGAWEYDIKMLAYKCNLTDIVAALGLVQLKRYPKLLERRREIIEKYNSALKDCNVQVLNHYDQNHKSCGHLYLVRLLGKDVDYRNKVIRKMAERGIGTNVHYKPLPMHTAYIDLGFDIKDYPNSYNMYKNEISLPLHTKLKDEDVAYIIENFKDILKDM
ncbi:MAG: DegT/DnrJ/EryC1/StrS family aminotransferase [Negativicutes bacterium]|nr:DegT/DnrJ/EryC1/StrS family aminotransferase [Negativicutes bacterium]